jgi:hypothetical protein
VKLRDCYKLDATVCPGCGSKCEPHEVYCCEKCWLIGGVKAPSDLGVNLARDWIYGYFSGYSGGRPVPEPKAPVIKYPDMCPCQIKSVMCDYHRGL